MTLKSKGELRIEKYKKQNWKNFGNATRIITGFEEMIVENFKGILEYEDFFVRINTHIGIININGFDLKLENMSDDDIKVTGKIESFDIERIT